MNLRNFVFQAFLIGLGFALHAIIPGVFFGMKPDMMLLTLFIGIILFPKAKDVLLMAIVTGVLSALTTNFPGGQIPNIIDKITTAFIFFTLLLIFKKISNNYFKYLALVAVGTVISGMIFLTIAFFTAGLPGGVGFKVLAATVVLPTAAINSILMAILSPAIHKMKAKLNETR